jgi:hypothetical protein
MRKEKIVDVNVSAELRLDAISHDQTITRMQTSDDRIRTRTSVVLCHTAYKKRSRGVDNGVDGDWVS